MASVGGATDTSGIYNYSDAVARGGFSFLDTYDSQHDPAACVVTGGWSCTGPTMYCTNNGGTDPGYTSESALETAIAGASDSAACITDPRTAASSDTIGSAVAGVSPDAGNSTACAAFDPTGKCHAAQSSDATPWAGARFLASSVQANMEASQPSGVTSTNGARVAGVIWLYPSASPNQECLHEVGVIDDYLSQQHFGDSAQHVYAAVNGGQAGSPTYCPNHIDAGTTYYQYVLIPGHYYAFRFVPGLYTGTQSQIFWADQWQSMGGAGGDSEFGCNSGGSSLCRIQAGSEFNESNGNVWPSMQAGVNGNGTNFMHVEYMNGSRVWHDWSSTVGANPVPNTVDSAYPYQYCAISNFVAFRTPLESSCAL